ncbi:hypothetical protein BD324DRAFT_84034 [Kockovaella imperatae]|uniref:Uncharacterized protein n=1 Tax=Kockovaella imperatae TaxID=4999 RepID=A0A1Y1UCL7_9TREE|nr:hypothetical protein BD324DRAFT_84034 [Kockovaella imperatae]ORX35246.1 hypothetical protein BD324DRAFT_84034 [Kockovaella imperatae]
MLSNTSRSYSTGARYDSNGVSSVSHPARNGFKTYRPSLTEGHLRRAGLYDPLADSSFHNAPFHKHRKEKERAIQRAEVDQFLDPAFQNTGTEPDGEAGSLAGPSRHHAPRTAGGLAGGEKRPAGVRASTSLNKLRGPRTDTTAGRSGVYLDASGKIHDTEFDPFAGVSEMSRRKSQRRRSAFGTTTRKTSESSSSTSGSEVGADSQGASVNGSAARTPDAKGEEEVRIKMEMERRRQEEASSLAAAKRRSLVSERGSLGGGRYTPSLRSSDEAMTTAQSLAMDRLGLRSGSKSGGYTPSPLSPTFGQAGTATSTTSFFNGGNRYQPDITIDESSPQKTTQVFGSSYSTTHFGEAPRQKEKTPMSVSVHDKKITVTGFDAPVTPTPVSPEPAPSVARETRKITRGFSAPQGDTLRVPDSGRMSAASSRHSNESARPRLEELAREDIFPETPAQAKRREEKQRRAARSTGNIHSRVGSLAIDTALTARGGGRLLPEIEIVEDDDPRIVFPQDGKTTRVQTKHDHVIRGPFSHAINAQSQQGGGNGPAGLGLGGSGGSALGRPSSIDQVTLGAGGVAGGSKAGSTILDENGGYLPSRWAGGDRALRTTEDEKEKYRPREWGGKHGDAHGQPEEWRPSTKEQFRRQWKDLSTNARFSMFRAKKKLLRKAEL